MYRHTRIINKYLWIEIEEHVLYHSFRKTNFINIITIFQEFQSFISIRLFIPKLIQQVSLRDGNRIRCKRHTRQINYMGFVHTFPSSKGTKSPPNGSIWMVKPLTFLFVGNATLASITGDSNVIVTMISSLVVVKGDSSDSLKKPINDF